MAISPSGYSYEVGVHVGYARTWSSFNANTVGAQTAKANASLLITQLLNYGFSLASACGICGMAMEESAINPGNKQGPSTSLGWGLIQWTPSTSLTNYSSDWFYGENQVNVINQEVMNIPPFNGRFFPSVVHPEYSYTGTQFKALSDPVESAKAYLWERGRGAESVMAKAIAIASENAYGLYEWYSGSPSPEPPPPTPPEPIPPSPPLPPYSYFNKGKRKKDNQKYRRR